MEFFDWINVVRFVTSFFTVAEVSTAAEYLEVLLRIFYISVGVAGGVYLVCLILGGVGMHAMAKKVGMKHSWLAFLPFANTYYAGKLAGETRVFGQKMKRVGLYAMLAEICYVVLGGFSLFVQAELMYHPEYFVDNVNSQGQYLIPPYVIDSDVIPMGQRWLTTADLVCEVLNYISYLVLIFFLCVLFYAFFRKYYARGPFLMTFLCAILPLRGFVIFAVRNNTPVDYDAYMRKKMEQYARAQRGYGQGGYDIYGNPIDPGNYGGNAPGGGADEDPFSDFGGSSAPSGGTPNDGASSGDGGNNGGGDSNPFPDF